MYTSGVSSSMGWRVSSSVTLWESVLVFRWELGSKTCLELQLHGSWLWLHSGRCSSILPLPGSMVSFSNPILWHRGQNLTSQSASDKEGGSFFCWFGDHSAPARDQIAQVRPQRSVCLSVCPFSYARLKVL